MGQYHVPVSVEAEESLDPHALGCGLKEGEQGFTRPGTPAPMIALVCARGGNMPADCSQSLLVGKWAGHRVLVQGDYAEDGDIENWNGPPLSLLYSATKTQEERDEETAYRQDLIDKGIDYPPLDWSNVPVYTDITNDACGFLEAACNIRFFGEGGLRNFVHVKPSGQHFGNCGVAEYVIDPAFHNGQSIEILKRYNMQPIDVQRVPRSGDWHGIRSSDIAEGQNRVIVNLDTMEYLNPAAFGQVPTLAGMVNMAPDHRNIPLLKKAEKDCEYAVDVAGGLFVMLCHRSDRGGGDLPFDGSKMKRLSKVNGPTDKRGSKAALFNGVTDIKGRWRGGRILGTAEHYCHQDWPTTEEVLEKGTDISGAVIKYLVALTHY